MSDARSGVQDVLIRAGDLFNLRATIEVLASLRIKSGRGARRIAKLVTILRTEIKALSDANDKLIEAHGKQNEDKVSYSLDTNDTDSFNEYKQAYQELMDDGVDVRFRPICLGDFGDVELPVSVMADLELFFDFEDDDIPDEKAPEEKPREEVEEEEPKVG
jgi:hypothetical protein